METESLITKRNGLKPGTHVIVFSDDWSLNKKTGIMLDPEPEIGSSNCLLEIEGEAVTLPIHDVFKTETVQHIQ